MHPLLRLTREERQYCDYYETQGKRGVLERRYPARIVLTSSTPSVTVRHITTRRARVFMVTWAGDTSMMRVEIQNSTGEHVTVGGSVHIPCLSGHSPVSTLSRRTDLALPAALYPWDTRWTFVLEPNVVLEAGQQLTITYYLEDPQDPNIPEEGWLLKHVVHTWEFPNWEGGIL